MNYEDYKKKEEKRIAIAINHLENGVEFADINSVYIEDTVEIEAGAYIGPCVTLEGKTKIAKGVKLFQNTRIVDSVIGKDSEIQSSVIIESSIGEETKVGPFAYIRPNSKIGNQCKVGDFVEVKNSTMSDGAKSAHLTYIGDSDIGENVNLGCGVVFVNYDGTNKSRSEVGEGAFIGCNSNIVAPVKVEKGAYIAAGSTITEDIPEDSLAIARSRQINKEGWAAKKGLYRKKK